MADINKEKCIVFSETLSLLVLSVYSIISDVLQEGLWFLYG